MKISGSDLADLIFTSAKHPSLADETGQLISLFVARDGFRNSVGLFSPNEVQLFEEIVAKNKSAEDEDINNVS